MNRTYKVIWSKARRCYVVVSELAKSQHKSSSKSEHISSNVHRGYLGKAAAAAVVASLLTLGGFTYSSVLAADTAAGNGNGVAIGTGSNAPKAENVAIGKGAEISYSNGASNATGDIVVGNGANINNYASQGGSIAIGKNAKVENMAGGGEASFAFGQTTFSGGWWSSSRIPADPSKVVGSIAIGDNTFARTGSTMIGSHNYKGELGDTTVDSASTRTDALNVYATTIGANSFSNGALTTSTGAYNIISSDYNGGRLANPVKNMGATITGALNSIESIKDAGYYSGIANTVSGIANRTSNSNGTLIYGAGNEVTNSITDLTSTPTDSGKSAKAFAEKLRTSIKESKSGGATLVIGGGNKADYTQKTQILGVNNTVTGTESNISNYNMIDGFGNTITGASHLYTIGDNNHITNTTKTIVFGDNRYVSNTNDSIIIGSSDKSDKPQYTTATDATIIGHNANAWGNRSMALGKDVYTTGDDSVAIGSAVAAYSKNSIAIGSSDGFYKTAVTDYSKDKPTEGGIAIGMGTLTNASHGTAIGYHAMVTNVDGYALGSKASVSTDKGVAIGYKATATVGDNALALGTSATSSGRDNIAIGTQAQATSSGANEEGTGQRMALGAYSNASGQASAAIGSGVNVNGNYSVGIGSHDASSIYASTNVSGDRAVGIGVQANVAGESAVGIGDTAIANGKQAVAIGKNANANNEDAFAFGTSANSSNKRALALGANANANHEDSVALGTSALASGNNALALGTNANVSGDNGIAIGASVTEQDKNEKDGKQHVKSALAAGINSTAIGTAASATGENSIVIGSYEMNQDGTVKNAQAVALDSMAFGTAANAWGQEGIAFGKDTGAGQNAIALGSKANAWKNHSTAIGNSAVGGAEYGVAIGEGAIVTNRYKDNGKGTYVEDTEHPATDAVAIGHNTLTNVKGGVAIGAGSVSSLDSGVLGYDPSKGDHSKDSSGIWKSTAAAVSVGDASKNITRQITNVAAGKQDTDAVNVAQLNAISSTVNTDLAASKTHFYSVNSTDEKAKNYDNKGATAANALAAGVGAQALKDSAVAIGDAAHAESSNSVVIGTGAWTRSSNGDKPTANGGDVAIGQKAYIDSYVNQGGSIALGQNARVENTNGSTERKYAFGQTGFEGDNIPLNPGNEAGGVAIGRNSFARTGSLMVGSHMYKGAIADMDEVDGTDSQKLRDNFNNINMTTLGTNSFNNGTFATVTGAYSATTAKKKIQNFAATVNGSLNSIESYKDAADNSGVASSIVGTANRIANSNNTTILGAGNEVTNSLTDFTAPTEGGASAKALQDTLKNTLQKDAKGAVVVSGIGNKVDSANSISLSGSRNTIKNTKNAQIFGDNREVTNSNGVIIIGSADKTLKTTNVQNSTIIGHNANAQNDALAVGESAKAGNNSIAIGMHANAGYSQNMALGYYASVADGVTNSTALGHGSQVTKRDILPSDGSDGVVSVGKSVGQSGEKGMTRRIINVKAGVNDTDAVNVSQLKGVQDGLTHFYSVGSQDETAGNYNNDGAKGKNSLAAGVGALAKGDNSVAIGTNAKAQNDALAVGENASAGNTGIAIGMHANAGYGQNMALGYYASVANDVRNSTALGYGSQVTKRDILKSDGSDGVISVGKSVGQSGEKGMTRRIINVKAGVNDTDAVNVSQLKQRAQAATTAVVAGTNIASVTNDTAADGHTIYTVNAKGTTVSGDDNFNITPKTNAATNVTDYAISLKNTITIGSGTGTHPITINGTDGVVSGLTNTTWDKNADYSKSTKAATEAQLQTAMKDAQEAAEANDTDTHVKAGTYAVTTVKDAAGKDTQGVALDVVDKTGTSVGKVTITDVAKASDVGDVSKLSKEVQNAEGSTTVVDAINNVNTKVNTVDNKVGDLNYSSTHYVKSGDNVTTSISNLDKAIHDANTEAGKHSTVSEGNNIRVTPDTTDGKTDYKVSLSDDINVNSVTAKTVTTDNLTVNKSATIGKVTINADDKGTIGGLTNKTWDSTKITHGQAATEDQLQAATKNAVNYDGDTKTITLREDTTINNVADTTIEEGSKNAVNAGTVYNETRVAKDGNFVKQTNTAGENLSALDNQVTANTESIYHINNRVSDLDNRVNKVGAGAAALAALHPLDFDPDDKWDFAVGYGNYRNANSVAFGAFYRPNEDTMFSLGTNFGNGENMFNAGLSFKIGQGSGITTSKTAMAKKIESLEDTVDKQDKKIAELEALVKEQGEMIRQYVGKK